MTKSLPACGLQGPYQRRTPGLDDVFAKEGVGKAVSPAHSPPSPPLLKPGKDDSEEVQSRAQR